MNIYLKSFVVSILAVLVGIFPQTVWAEVDEHVVELEKKLGRHTRDGDYLAAEQTAREMIAYADKIPNDHQNRCYIFSDASAAYKNLQNYERGLKLAQQALDEAKLYFAPDDTELANPLANFGVCCWGLGRLREAEMATRKALAMRQRRFGAESDDVVDSLDDLAMMVDDLGRYAEARAIYQQSLQIEIRLHGTGSRKVGRILSNIASSFFAQGRFSDAEQYCREGLKNFQQSLPPHHPEWINAYIPLAHVCMRTGRLEEAEKYLKKAFDICSAAQGKETALVMFGDYLANLYERQGRQDESIRMYHEHLDRLRKSKAPPQLLVRALTSLGKVLSDADQYDQAEQLLTEAIDLGSELEQSPLERFSPHLFRGEVRVMLEKLDDAQADFLQAIKYVEGMRAQLSGSTVEQAEAFSKIRLVYEWAGIVALMKNENAKAFDYFERGRARGLLDQMAAAHLDPLEGLPADKRSALREEVVVAERAVKQAEEAFDEMLNQTATNGNDRQTQLAPYRERVAEARDRLVAAQAAITNANPAYRKAMAKEVNPPSFERISDWCHDQETILLYYTATEAGIYLLFVDPVAGQSGSILLQLTGDQGRTLGIEPGELTAQKSIDLVHTEKHEGLLDLLRNPNRSAEQYQQLIDRLSALWQVLVPEQLRASITGGKAKRLAIIPSGGLSCLPFESLVVKHVGTKDITYLLDECPPTMYAPSATVLMNLLERRPPQDPPDRLPVLTVGDPSYDTGGSEAVELRARTSASAAEFRRAGGKLQRLPFSGEESKAVAKAFQQHKIGVGQLLQKIATEASVRVNAPRRTLLHLACHGCASSAYGNFYGGLALAKGPKAAIDPADDGFLTVAEIYPLDLRHCELAILSACQTNLGPSDTGEGTWAISRAFLVAGARRVVASFWEVDDAATSKLVSNYCESIAAGMEQKQPDYAEGLHKAKRSLRGSSRTSDPAFWAPFVLVGPQ